MLLERDDLLATLGNLLECARSGDGSLVLLAGEAGSGKTSVTRELANSVGDTAVVLWGACDPLSTPRPLSPLHDFAADPDSGLSGLLDEHVEAVETFGTVLARLKGTLRPVLMVVEDLHWADEGTLDFVRFVGRRVADTNALAVCTYRDDEVGPDHPLKLVLGQLGPMETTHRLDVRPLSVAAVAVLAGERAVDAEALHRLTDGNAFYVTEVIAAEESLPGTVQEAVLARVGRLGDGPRRVVEAVSIAPRSLEISHVGLLTGALVEDIDETAGSGVLAAEGRFLSFRHELARAAVEESIPMARRLDLHRRMLSLLEDADSPDRARLAHHAMRADAADLVVDHAPLAAQEASKRGAHKEAISFYESVLSHPELVGDDRVAEFRLALATEFGIVDRQGEALRQATLAVDHYRAGNRTDRLAAALVQVAGPQWSLGDAPSCRATIDEAVELLTRLGPSRDLAHALYTSSHFYMLARQGQFALEVVKRSAAMAEEFGANDIGWSARLIIGCIEIITGAPLRGLAVLNEIKEEAERGDDPHRVAKTLGMLGSGGGEARLYDDAISALDEGIVQGLAADEDYAVAYNRSWLARIAFEQGRWNQAVEYAELVDRTSSTGVGIANVTARGALGRVRVRRGDPGGRELIEDTLQLGVSYELQHVWAPLCGLAEHEWLSGRAQRIPVLLSEDYGRALDTDSQWARGELGFWMWRAGAIDGPPDNAARPFALQMAGEWRAAAEAWREIGCPYEVALALADGDETACLEALPTFDSLGARPAASLVRARLRDVGVKNIPKGPTKQTLANPAGLTSRQLEVLGLMASGMSNAEIADELFLAKKTVEHHVSAIFSKLSVTTRAKAIVAAHELGTTQK